MISLSSWDVPFWLGVVVPASTILCLVVYDTLNLFGPLRAAFQFITIPITNFYTLQDLRDPIGTLSLPPSWKLRVLCLLLVLELLSWIATFVFSLSVSDGISSVRAGVSSLLWGYAALRTVSKPLFSPPYGLMIFYLAMLIAAFGDLYFGLNIPVFSNGQLFLNIFWISIPVLLIFVSGTLPLQPIPPGMNIAVPGQTTSNKFTCPEDSVDLWQWSTFSFVEPIFKAATSHTVNEQDVWTLSPFFKHRNVFGKYLEYSAMYPTHSLLRFLLVSNSLDLILDSTLEMWSAVIGFVPPYALQRILSVIGDSTPGAKDTAYFFALLTFLANLSFAQKDLFKNWHTRRCYERTRGQLFCSLHYKALKRQDITGKTSSDDDNQGSADLGKVVNLMQGDAYAVSQRFWEFSGIFASPVRLIIALVFLYQILGWSSLAGVVVVLVAYILNYPLARYNIHITRFSWKAKDKRMNIVNELFQNLRFLKFYGWESHWEDKVKDAREKELKWRIQENAVDTLISFIWTWIPSATALSTFMCYTLVAGERLTVSKAFTSIALFSQLQEPMTALPGQFFALLHAYVSMQRIEEFLREDEVPDWASSLKNRGSPPDKVDEVGFDNAVFEWNSYPGKKMKGSFQLGPLDFTFPQGQLSLIKGATGSGRSALLLSLLGEMHCLSGRSVLNKMGHQVAYCAQNPWLEHATIRDNIIFGSNFGYDEVRYNSIVEACALRQDLSIFEAGDLTEIGEKGITLSPGQRARIALARALYSQASCILLDDPFAAVDMHTAQQLVDALSGPIAHGRTIILVTHHISLCLPIASYLVELSQGKVLQHGSVQELRDRGVLDEVIEKENVIVGEGSIEPTVIPLNEADIGYVQNPGNTNGKLIEVEARAEGRISSITYATYIRAAGIWAWFATTFLMIAIRLINVANQVFLAQWGEAYDQSEEKMWMQVVQQPHYPLDRLPSPDVNVRPWLLIFFWICAAGAFSVFAYIALGYYASLQASRSLFISMLQRLVRTPSRFLDITPIGRILNRFTSDINTVDGALQNSARGAMGGTLNFCISFMVIIWVVPTFVPVALIMAWLYIRIALPYIQASRDLRRLESISLSPAFAGFDELLMGLPHIRAFAMESRYQDAFYTKVDRFQTFDHVYWLCSGWLRWRYDCLGSVVVFAATLFALWSNVDNGSAAIVIVQSGVFAEASRQLVRVLAQVELDFNSVERIVEYLNVPQEAPLITEKRPPAYWPSSNGGIHIDNLVVRYSEGLPAVLKGLTFSVLPREKIGIVGRTGSGKSTLALSLLRMVEASEGKIIIDGIDISKIGLEDLRTRITIISQDVAIFQGTIRTNLDPFEQHSDVECLQVLERCHLTPLLRRGSPPETDLSNILHLPVAKGGLLSAGEKQLLALARAVLRRTNIVIMDEATSQIDSRLDDQIQHTIREELVDTLVITIAHRLNTIMDYDRVLVLGEGEVLEFDAPRKLLQNEGPFRRMCRASVDWTKLSTSS